MITYDSVWQTFLNNYRTENYKLPQTNEKIYEHIKNAVILHNNRLRLNAICDDASEVIDGISTEDDKLLVAQYIKLVWLQNEHSYFNELMNPLKGDIGQTTFNSQLRAFNTAIERQEKQIEKFIFNMQEDFI